MLTDAETEEVFNSAEEQSLKFHKVYLILYCFLVDGHVWPSTERNILRSLSCKAE